MPTTTNRVHPSDASQRLVLAGIVGLSLTFVPATVAATVMKKATADWKHCAEVAVVDVVAAVVTAELLGLLGAPVAYSNSAVEVVRAAVDSKYCCLMTMAEVRFAPIRYEAVPNRPIAVDYC